MLPYLPHPTALLCFLKRERLVAWWTTALYLLSLDELYRFSKMPTNLLSLWSAGMSILGHTVRQRDRSDTQADCNSHKQDVIGTEKNTLRHSCIKCIVRLMMVLCSEVGEVSRDREIREEMLVL